ncbi:MAG: hypothetical protein KatS3mg099_123 [Candidatus Parcubacteria bacterium]|nr:MAG: hypothetical protein KatS3mg099_123 [Candidatus Parcubacteria bacterium]
MSVVARYTLRTRRALVALALLVVVLLPASAHAALPEPWRSLLHQPVESAVWVGEGILDATAAAQRSLASAFTTLTDTLGAALYTAFFPQPQEPQPIVRLAAAHRTDEQQPDTSQPPSQEQSQEQQEPPQPEQPTPPPIIITTNTKDLEEQLSSLQQAYQALVLAFLSAKEDEQPTARRNPRGTRPPPRVSNLWPCCRIHPSLEHPRLDPTHRHARQCHHHPRRH